jgi:hemolysin activation/secretion protein
LEVSYPIFRSRKQNLNITLNLDEKRFDNQSAGLTVRRYKVIPLSIALTGNLVDQFGGGGANSASLTVIQGHLYDRASSATPDGSYSKFKYTFSRQQVLTEDLSVFGSVSGQKASRNLDSSENFGLGGNSAVRAYPTGEGSGNEGWMMNLEARLRLPEGFYLTSFYDHGQISMAKSPSGTGLNDYVLQGVGLTLVWQSGSYPTLKATWAHRIGENPNQTATGFDQDGSLTKNRFWLSASVPF